MTGPGSRGVGRPPHEALHDAGRYALLDEIDHGEIVAKVNSCMKFPSPVRAAYLAANASVAALAALA